MSSYPSLDADHSRDHWSSETMGNVGVDAVILIRSYHAGPFVILALAYEGVVRVQIVAPFPGVHTVAHIAPQIVGLLCCLRGLALPVI
jgi:hypothetical protein